MPPAEFIPMAEETGLILAIGRQVLVDATQQTARWNALPGAEPLGVSVNISARQLIDGTLVDHVRESLMRSGLPASALTLELTESVLVHDIDVAAGILVELKALGVKLAIDDFGTGYSSLSYLARLPVDILKVDKTFVAGVERDTSEARLAATVVAMANSLRLQTIVEGIETESQLAAMRRLGCTLFQGYLWSPPVDAPSFAALVSRGGVPLPPPRRMEPGPPRPRVASWS
jgi:EAL domain-containing protein (putative c-di-GMP-specific phosphodiesterase class I)